MSYYVRAHQTFEDQYPSPTKYLPLNYLLERHLEILKCKFMCVWETIIFISDEVLKHFVVLYCQQI